MLLILGLRLTFLTIIFNAQLCPRGVDNIVLSINIMIYGITIIVVRLKKKLNKNV